MSNEFEPTGFSFRKDTGGKTEVEIISEKKINGGNFGNIFDAVVEIGGHKKRFIIKKYLANEWRSATQRASFAFENYSRAKKAGLRVFLTFRIGEDNESILMTTGFKDNQICIGSKNHRRVTVESFGRPKIKEFSNLDRFLEEFFTEGLKAAHEGIEIYKDDVPFFILTKDEPTEIDFVFGDMDNLIKAVPIEHVEIRNLERLNNTLYEFGYENVDPNSLSHFLDRVKYYYNQAVRSVNNDTALAY